MKIKKIKNCRECQDIIYIGYPDNYPSCSESFKLYAIVKKIIDIDSIPEWCPLENYKKEYICLP